MDPGIYKNPSIYIGSLRVDEPVTMITDILVSVVCFYVYYLLRKEKLDSRLKVLYEYFFLFMGIATCVGGIVGHGFTYLLSIYWKIPGWYLSMFAIAFAERASILYAGKLIRPAFAQFFVWLNIFELIIFLILSVLTMNFYFVVGHSAYGLLVVIASFQAYIYYRTRHRGSKMFLIAVFYSALAGLIYLNQWAISKWFNHIDIGHVFMALSCWYIYLGAKGNMEEPDYGIAGHSSSPEKNSKNTLLPDL